MRPSNFIERVMEALQCIAMISIKSPGFVPAVFVAASLSLGGSVCSAQTQPTWLHRFLPDVAEKSVDLSSGGCHYRPIFGEGDSASRVPRSVARFGEITVDSGGACRPVAYPREEQIYVVTEGTGVLQYGDEKAPVRKNDFMYLAPGVNHAISASAGEACRVLVMGFRIPAETTLEPPGKLQLANIDDVKEQTVGGHPSSVLYKLLVGDRKSKRDKIAAGYVVTSLFIMDFAPGGTNTPHNHDTAEEIYLVLDGHGNIVAGGGMDGVEGLHPASAGDAYFYRLNCTVGFYNSAGPNAKAHILAVRSWFPFSKSED